MLMKNKDLSWGLEYRCSWEVIILKMLWDVALLCLICQICFNGYLKLNTDIYHIPLKKAKHNMLHRWYRANCEAYRHVSNRWTARVREIVGGSSLRWVIVLITPKTRPLWEPWSAAFAWLDIVSTNTRTLEGRGDQHGFPKCMVKQWRSTNAEPLKGGTSR